MAQWKIVSKLPQFAKTNRADFHRALKSVTPIIEREIKKKISKTPGGHLHASGDTLRQTKVVAVSGANARIEVRTTEQGVYQDQGFTHYQSGEFIHNPFITPVLFGMRNSILSLISRNIKKGK